METFLTPDYKGLNSATADGVGRQDFLFEDN